MKFTYKSLLIATLLSAAYVGNASATMIAYEALPTANSDNTSQHIAGGPVLADDFQSMISGNVYQVDWWGTQAGSNSWEITFHPDNNGQPGVKTAQHFVTAVGNDDDGDGIFSYSALWNPQDMFISAGVDYWFSVANAAAGWNWANAGVASVGSEAYDAVVSTGVGPDGGPHFGPWNGTRDVTGAPTPEDFAFRIHVVPEPATIAMLSLGLLGLAMRKRPAKATTKVAF